MPSRRLKNLYFCAAVASAAAMLTGALNGATLIAVASGALSFTMLVMFGLDGRGAKVARLERRLERASRGGIHVIRLSGSRGKIAAAEAHIALGELPLTNRTLEAASRIAGGLSDWHRTSGGLPDPDDAGRFVDDYFSFLEALKTAGMEAHRSARDPSEESARNRLLRAIDSARDAAFAAFAAHEAQLREFCGRIRGTHPEVAIESRRAALSFALARQVEEYERMFHAIEGGDQNTAVIAGRRYADAVALTRASAIELNDALKDRAFTGTTARDGNVKRRSA